LVRGLPRGAERNIEFERKFDLGEERLNAVFYRALQARETLVQAQQAANEAAALAVAEGQSADMSLRDLATLIGISHQRVQQIASAIRERPTPVENAWPPERSETPDPMAELSGRLYFRVVDQLGPTLYERIGISDAELRLRVLEMLEWAIGHEESVPLTSSERRVLVNEVASDILDHARVKPS
jgi:hypothetical protein